MKKDEMERLLAEKAERNCLGEEEKGEGNEGIMKFESEKRL